ncbi:MAG: patatin-like phospholipase family protein [Candidatus Omnitrophica bacterium]|nr:patatin-like phospholipase family protein [Candidatus Omnitrophota bacterium]
MKNAQVFALACTGGGAHGAYQVGVLKYIHQHFCREENLSPFQIFTGSSCGALNTSFYAAQSFDAYQSRLWLEELWLDFHVPAYHGNMLKNILQSFYQEFKKSQTDRNSCWSLLDPMPMREVIKRGFQRENLERAFRHGSTLGIGVSATELVSGRSCWFLEGRQAATWDLFHSTGLRDSVNHHHVEASCSVPVFLPPVKIGERYYLDGSISLSRPLSAALAMGATKILNISTQRKIPYALPEYSNGFRPRLKIIIRMLLNRLSYDAASDEAEIHKSLPVEIYLFQPSKRIDSANINIGHEVSRLLRRKTTRFMFHEKFVREIIQLGYDDAKAKHEDLESFFGLEKSQKKWFF